MARDVDHDAALAAGIPEQALRRRRRAVNATTREGIASQILQAHDLGAAVGEQLRAIAAGEVTGQAEHPSGGNCRCGTRVVLLVVSSVAAALQSSNHLRSRRISRSAYSFEQSNLALCTKSTDIVDFKACDVGSRGFAI